MEADRAADACSRTAAYDRLGLMDKIAYLDFVLEIIRRRDGVKGFKVQPRGRVLGRPFDRMIRWRRSALVVAMGSNPLRSHAHP